MTQSLLGLELAKKIISQPGFGYSLFPDQMQSIGYDPSIDPDWPSYEGIVRQAKKLLKENNIDPSKPF